MNRDTQRPREMISCELDMTGFDLPNVYLQVNGDVGRATGEKPIEWTIYSERETLQRARTQIKANIDGLGLKLLADITIHVKANEDLAQEVQEVSAAILWSGIRSWAKKQIPFSQHRENGRQRRNV